MINRAEKLSLLSEMIAFAQTDENIKSIEYNFLFSIAKQLDISKEDFDESMQVSFNNKILHISKTISTNLHVKIK